MKSLQEEIGKKRPFELPEEEAYLNVLRTAAVLNTPFARLLKSQGLSESTYNVLRILRGVGPDGAACGLIRQRLIAQVPDVTRLIDRLVTLGQVKRDRTERDRRVVLNRITAKGLELLARLDEPLKRLHQSQCRHMAHAELQELSRLLTKIRNAE